MGIPLFDEFVKSKKYEKGTIENCRTYLNRNVLEGILNPNSLEMNYLDIVAFSIAAKRKDLAEQLITRIKEKLGPRDSIKKSNIYQAYGTLEKYYEFVQGNSVKSITAKESLSKCCVYGYSSFKSKINSSLKSQSRISGDKTWLPLIVLRKLYSGSDVFNQWINSIYDKTRIVIYDHAAIPACPKPILVKDIKYIGICRSGDVFALYNDCWLQVMTPTGYLNTKCNMQIFGDCRNISIDHMTPIDNTLRRLKLPQLEMISRFVKVVKETQPGLSGKELENEAFTQMCRLGSKSGNRIKIGAYSSFKGGIIDLISLRDELDSISNDSHYILTDGSINLKKSNLLTYTKFFKDETGPKYYGYIGECKIDSTTDGVIYQDLDTNYPNVIYKTIWDKLENSILEEINAVEVPIDKL